MLRRIDSRAIDHDPSSGRKSILPLKARASQPMSPSPQSAAPSPPAQAASQASARQPHPQSARTPPHRSGGTSQKTSTSKKSKRTTPTRPEIKKQNPFAAKAGQKPAASLSFLKNYVPLDESIYQHLGSERPARLEDDEFRYIELEAAYELLGLDPWSELTSEAWQARRDVRTGASSTIATLMLCDVNSAGRCTCRFGLTGSV